jgi:hypothetical protein
VISGIHYKMDGNCTLVGYYTVSSGNFLQESRIQKVSGPLKMGPFDCPELSVRNYLYLLYNILLADLYVDDHAMF